MNKQDLALSTIFAIALCGLTIGIGTPAGLRVALAEEPSADMAAQKRTVLDIRNVGTAMFSWLTDQIGAAAAGQSQMPEPSRVELSDYSEISHADLTTILTPMYLETIPETDGWGSPYEFGLNVENPLAQQVMSMRSPGRDGFFDGDSYEVDSFDPASFDEDIVWADGFFVRWPLKPNGR
ncbi:MAG TPA: hypothetical protein VJ885_19755 [Thermoanaerobaculia bacterium]|nr:hypothetical protein [Thermoanaerobaculia bacterium]